jgi:hypothetical protein
MAGETTRDLIEQAKSRLLAQADVRADLKPVIQVALDAIDAAQEDAEAQVKRAELTKRAAESSLSEVRPHVEAIARQADEANARADEAERRLAEVEEQLRERDRLDQLRELADGVERLVAAQKASNAAVVERNAELIAAVHRCAKDSDGLSPLRNTSEFEGAPWTVTHPYDARKYVVVEKRSDAIDLVARLVQEKWNEPAPPPTHEDAPGSPKRRRRSQPGETASGPRADALNISAE